QSSTLFPYTTLFRSGLGNRWQVSDARGAVAVHPGRRGRDLPSAPLGFTDTPRRQPGSSPQTSLLNLPGCNRPADPDTGYEPLARSEEHTSELQSREN